MNKEEVKQLEKLENKNPTDRGLALEWIGDLKKYANSQNWKATKEKIRYLVYIMYQKIFIVEQDDMYIECLQEALDNAIFHKEELAHIKTILRKVKKGEMYEELVLIYELLDLLAKMGDERNQRIVQESKYCSYNRRGIMFSCSEKLANPKEFEIIISEKVKKYTISS